MWRSIAAVMQTGKAVRLLDLVLGFVLLRAALAHLANPYFFLSTLYDYGFPILAGKLIAAFVPYLELIVALALLTTLWSRPASLWAAILLTAFVVAQSIAWARGLDISCGCFGATGTEKIGLLTVGRDVLLAALAWLSFWKKPACDMPARLAPSLP